MKFLEGRDKRKDKTQVKFLYIVPQLCPQNGSISSKKKKDDQSKLLNGFVFDKPDATLFFLNPLPLA